METDRKKAELIKSALMIVDELGKLDEEYIIIDGDDSEILEKIIKNAKKLRKNKFWRLT